MGKYRKWSDYIKEYVSGRIMQTVRNAAHPGNKRDITPEHKGSLGGTAQRTYLMDRDAQRRVFLDDGYIEGTTGDYGLVTRAVGNRKLPVYQTAKDKVKRDDLVSIGTAEGFEHHGWDGPSETALLHAGHYPISIYIDGKTGNFYQKAWDLNDYGGGTGASAGYEGIFEKGANYLDKIGSPVVVTTGYQPVTSAIDPDKPATLNDVLHWNGHGEYESWNNQGDAILDFVKQRNLQISNVGGNPVITLPDVNIVGKKKRISLED